MCGLSAVPVGDIRFETTPSQSHLNVTWPTDSDKWNGERIVVEFDNGAAIAEYVEDEDGVLVFREVSRDWRSYIPGLIITAPTNFYLPMYEWKVVPEEMPLLWTAPMWCFMTGVVTLVASNHRKRDILLVALVLVSISASLLLIAAHRLVELTHFCSECDSMTKYMSDDGMTLGKLPDSTEDPDYFADNNCPHTLHIKCEGGRNIYLAGGVINLICMYFMLITVEYRRHKLHKAGALSSQDQMQVAH
jgi:hypothetical protein